MRHDTQWGREFEGKSQSNPNLSADTFAMTKQTVLEFKSNLWYFESKTVYTVPG